ncbi:hypothetical protein SARC_08227 [Sphaeroforma arctica JP610]|uniref:SWIM-type domain-containing protein n=1 Tax=Sphaeroforma arctica JP610 TaxID=667725 RepID=A0A0L0FS04_9EUKA|nr:hypothetical protein SARC_08227 [Sphaeroforma arctica JP610]KNC79381.1 hypothetical protein SARC_08227 [Sphaeroforma arctica JP610]|eukprot:XP_014153283.1 hypothetical protein SARC_08227 [Sphaeroforma arctica JP610]
MPLGWRLTQRLKQEDDQVLEGYCACSLDAGRRCVHVAALVWAIQQATWGKLSSDEDDLSTSKPSKWNVSSGNHNDDIEKFLTTIIVKKPRTAFSKQDQLIAAVYGTRVSDIMATRP